MSQGDHVRINSKKAVEKQLPFLLKRVESWDYSTPLVIKFERYDDPRSLGQNALFHIWCREMSEVFVKKVPNATEEGMKFMMKSMFLGTHSIAIGKETYSDQVMPLPKKKGEMCFFMDQVYAWAAEKDVLLSLPQYNEYTALKRKQEA
jgi:hypothetical protein